MTFDLEHLISKRAAGRTRIHFANLPSEGAPEGHKNHENPLMLSWGTPNDGFFPIESLEVDVAEAPFQESMKLAHTNNSLEALGSAKDCVEEPKEKVVIEKRMDDPELIDMRQGFQYSLGPGLPQLLKFIDEFIVKTHEPGYKEWGSILTTGAGDAILKATDAILNEGDVVLLEEFTFTPTMMMIKEAGGVSVPTKLDVSSNSQGLDLDYLTNLLDNWDELKPELKGRKPKALYTIPTGQNPTGLTQTLEFRKKVYALAEKHDFLIIEDDPYGYLTLPPYKKPDGMVKLDDFITTDDYINHHLTPSYLTIDTKGRVLRLETFSKLFCPGIRIGFIVAHKSFIDVIARYLNLVTKFPSGFSQTILQNVLQQKFHGVDGWIQWILKMRLVYIHKRNLLVGQLYDLEAYAKKYIDIIDPRAGMFISVIINFPPETDIIDKMQLLNWKFAAFGVGVVPGINMAVDKQFSKERGNFYRLTFAPLNNDNEIVEGTKRLVTAIEEFFEKKLEY